MSFKSLKDDGGKTIMVNPDQVRYLAPSPESSDGTMSIIYFDHNHFIVVMGGVSEVAGQLREAGSR